MATISRTCFQLWQISLKCPIRSKRDTNSIIDTWIVGKKRLCINIKQKWVINYHKMCVLQLGNIKYCWISNSRWSCFTFLIHSYLWEKLLPKMNVVLYNADEGSRVHSQNNFSGVNKTVYKFRQNWTHNVSSSRKLNVWCLL